MYYIDRTIDAMHRGQFFEHQGAVVVDDTNMFVLDTILREQSFH
jgi:hypothetical protein